VVRWCGACALCLAFSFFKLFQLPDRDPIQPETFDRRWNERVVLLTASRLIDTHALLSIDTRTLESSNARQTLTRQ
jgi:hypothetical protein